MALPRRLAHPHSRLQRQGDGARRRPALPPERRPARIGRWTSPTALIVATPRAPAAVRGRTAEDVLDRHVHAAVPPAGPTEAADPTAVRVLTGRAATAAAARAVTAVPTARPRPVPRPGVRTRTAGPAGPGSRGLGTSAPPVQLPPAQVRPVRAGTAVAARIATDAMVPATTGVRPDATSRLVRGWPARPTSRRSPRASTSASCTVRPGRSSVACRRIWPRSSPPTWWWRVS